MNSTTYDFNVEDAFMRIQQHWSDFMMKSKMDKCVIGISGGKDSTVVAALAEKIFGRENVIGVMMPCDYQSDIDDSKKVCDLYCGKSMTIDIGDANHSLLEKIENQAIEVTEQTKINIQPRLRMTALYAIAQCLNGCVINTSNFTESCMNYMTLFGDMCGSYAPIKDLTVTEVLALGDWLGVPYDLVHKAPSDGLSGKTDEERLGVKYADVDNLLRKGIGDSDFKCNVFAKYNAGKFKRKMISIEGPTFEDLPNYAKQMWR